MKQEEPLTRPQIRAIFKRHRSAASRLAEALDVGITSISDWFSKVSTRRRSVRVDAAVRLMAERLSAKTNWSREEIEAMAYMVVAEVTWHTLPALGKGRERRG